MSRMPKTLLAVVAAGLLVGCNSYNRPTTQIGYWPDYEDEKSLNDGVLNARPSSQIATSHTNAPVPGEGTYIAPAPQPTNVQIVSPAPAPQPVFTTPAPAPAPAPVYVQPAPQPTRVAYAPIPTPAAAPAPAGRATTYTVKNGDSLWKIAKRHYGNALRWKEIAAANPNINPDRLKLGQKLTLPVIGRNSRIVGAAAAARPAKAGVEDQATFK